MDRTLLHTRTITCEGYERDDGRWDIDGWMTDVKTYEFSNKDRGTIPAGEPVHGMGMRMTVDLELNVYDVLAVTDFSPFRICPNITPNFSKLAGLNLSKGFMRAAREIVGGTKGCTHLFDLLGPMATTAYQTMDEQRYAAFKEKESRGEAVVPFFVDSCHAWASNGNVLRKEFPSLYKGSK
ncbi:MAG: DUF2889 domain-containing protein [Rhodospirillaceae bacterium]